MNRVFISYSGNRIDRAEIFYALREHGINPWRDVESLALGNDTTETIESELGDCSGVILWINEDLLQSDYVARVELPTISRVHRRRPLRIVPVFDGMTPGDAAERVSRMGVEIGESNGHVVDPGAVHVATAASVAAKYTKGHVQGARATGAEPIVRMVTYDDTAALHDQAVLNLDWRHHLTDGSLTSAAEQRLRSALAASTAALKASYGAREITLAVKAHLPFAVALGHAFSQPTGCTLRFHREGGDWITVQDRCEVPTLDEQHPARGPVTAGRASVEVSVTRDVDTGVAGYVGEGNRYRHRIVLMPVDGPGRGSVNGADTVNGWARQIAETLIRVSDLPDVDQTDLFLAAPVELGAMVGWWANAAGHIGLMDWGKTGPYRRLWALP